MSLKTWMDWLELFLPYLGNPFCFWFSPSRQLSHMKTSFQLRRRRPQSIILIFSLWSTAPPNKKNGNYCTCLVVIVCSKQAAIIGHYCQKITCSNLQLLTINCHKIYNQCTTVDTIWQKNWLRWAFTSGTCPEVLNAICFMLRKLQDRYMSTPCKPFSGTIFNLSSCL